MKHSKRISVSALDLTGIGEEILLDVTGQLIVFRLYNGNIVRDQPNPNAGSEENTLVLSSNDYREVG